MRMLCCAICIVMTANMGPAWMLPEAKLTVRLIEEDGRALSGMEMVIGFSEESRRGSTDTNGFFTATGKETYGDPGFSCSWTGWYASRSQYRFSGVDTNSNRWLPWNPVVTMVVRRVVHPIPMYWKRVETKIPAENTPLGFDLMSGDWVPPFGSGEKADLVFVFTKRIVSRSDFEGVLRLTFSNPMDGIVANSTVVPESTLRIPRYAVEDGYQTNWMSRVGRDTKSGAYGAVGMGEDRSYFLRVRSIADDKGKIKEAFYCKVSGEIRVRGVARAGSELVFTYYLNPNPNDRNMECDHKGSLVGSSDP